MPDYDLIPTPLAAYEEPARKTGPRVRSLAGRRVGMLTVTSAMRRRLYHDVSGAIRATCIYWKCRCDCGNVTWIASSSLRTGRQHSCGCAQYKGRLKK